MAKHFKQGVPEFSGQRVFNATGDELTGIYNFKDETSEKHFRMHKLGKDRIAGKEIKTEWHSEMQARFLKTSECFKHEVHYQGINGGRRQADIVYNDEVCIELQYSNISKDDILARTKDALNKYKKIIWIFNHDTMLKSKECLHQRNIYPSIKFDGNYANWLSPKYFLDMTEEYRPNDPPILLDGVFWCRASTAPVWTFLKYPPQDYMFETKLIKQYSKTPTDFSKDVFVIFHDFDEDRERFHIYGKGLTRGEAKAQTQTTDFQKRMSYVTRHKPTTWNAIINSITQNSS
jgi:hypothetical protein